MAALKDTVVSYWRSMVSASSLRPPFRGEALVLTVTTASKTYNVPASWSGLIVDFQADGSDVYLQVAGDANAAADPTTASQETLASGRYTLAANATPNECRLIPKGSFLPVQMTGVVSFAVIGVAACKLRCHPSES